MLNLVKAERVFEHEIRFLESFVEISPLISEVVADVGPLEPLRRPISRAAQLGSGHIAFVNQRSARSDGVVDTGYFRQLFIFDIDEIEGFFGPRRIIGQNRRHWIADVTNFIHRNDALVLIGCAVAIIEIFDVIPRQNSDDSGEICRLGSIDLDQLGVSHRTAKNFRVGHSRQFNITRVDGFAGDLFNSVHAMSVFTHRGIARRLFHGLQKTTTRPWFRSGRPNDLLANFRTVFFRKVKIAIGAVEIHLRP